jgi:RNA polymerase sigma-70 factor (ECF subfamily)
MSADPQAEHRAHSLEDDARDVAWMERIRNGDTEALRELIEAHQMRVIGTVARMMGNDSDAEEIAQQVFIRVWSSAARYKPTAKFTTWLFKITRNLVFNEFRRRKRHPTTPIETDDYVLQASDPQSSSPDAALLDAELQSAIQKAIEALPEVQRMAIVLRRYNELPYEEIAEILEISVPALKSVLFRARAELRTRLQKYLDA